MSEWISVKKMPRIGVGVDLWISGEADTIKFYDPTVRPGATCGRTVNWCWDGRSWRCSEGLSATLSPSVEVTHWQPLPAPPESEHPDGE